MKMGQIERGWKRLGLGMAAVVTMGLALGGCANQANYDQLLDTVRTQDEQIQRLQRDLKEREAELAALQRSGNSGDAALQQAIKARNEAEARLAAANARLDDLDKRISSASLTPLDAETDSALRELASKYPQLISYDSSRGMLRFNSDLTFDSGKAIVKDGARSSLDALASVLNSSSAAQYEVMVVGHTDAQKISIGTAKEHPTNMHLSCHRAISVRDALIGMRVPAGKVFSAGWGEERPAVPNRGNGNTPENRRVEIYLTGSTAGGSHASATTDSGPAPAPVPVDRNNPPSRQPDMTK